MAATLYAAKAGSATTSDLYTVDPVTAALTSVGAIGFAVTGMAFDPTDGTLYGVTSNNSSAHPNSIITIDPVTGAGTFVAALSIHNVPDISFRSDGQMFGWTEVNTQAVSIDKATGVVTLLGSTFTFGSFGDGNSFDSGDTWYACILGGPWVPFAGSFPDWSWLTTIDPSTGAVSGVAKMTGGPFPSDNAAISAASFDFTDDSVLWAVVNDFGIYEIHLVTIDKATGALTDIGIMETGQPVIDALAWSLEAAGPADHVAFSVQPTDTCADATITPAVTVRIEDASNVLVTSSTAAVTLAIGTNPGGGTLSGTLTVNAVGGVATFSDLSIDAAGVGYTLVASSSGLTSDTSSTFDITSSDGATCADAIVISGATGCDTGNTVCGGAPGTDDPLADWYGDAMGNTVFYRYVAPASGYIQLTLTRPGGSTFTQMVGGVFHDFCGNAIEGDDTLNTPTYNEAVDGAPPGVFGTPVTVGDVVYIEIATDVDQGGDPGAYELCWELRTIVNYDCFDETVQVGPPYTQVPNTTFGGDQWYERTDDGRHWMGVAVDQGGGVTDARVGILAADGSGSWNDTLVQQFTDQSNVGCDPDNDYWWGGPRLVTDGTEMWAVIRVRDHTYFDGLHSCWIPEIGSSYWVYHWNGASWDQIGTVESVGDTMLTSNHDAVLGPFTVCASAADPGVMYLFMGEQGDLYGRCAVAKFDTSAKLWENDVFTVAGSGSMVVTNLSLLDNAGGSAVLFYCPYNHVYANPAFDSMHQGADVDMYAVDPSTGALTLLQSLPNTSTSVWFTDNFSISNVWQEGTGPVDMYLFAVQEGPSTVKTWVYEVPVDGSAPFDYILGDPSISFYFDGFTAFSYPAARIFEDPPNVWIPDIRNTIAHLDLTQVCISGWERQTPPKVLEDTFFGPSLRGFVAADFVRDDESADFYALASYQPPGTSSDIDFVVFRLTYHPSCFCELGPPILVAGVYRGPVTVG